MAEKIPAVLVLHAWWGLNDTIRNLCKQLADEGFLAFAPDLYHGKIAYTVAEAEALSKAVDVERAKREVADAVASLGGNVAVLGFSFGAYFALELSVTDPERIRSVVVFYGTRPGDYSRSKAAYLGHFAETDEYEPRSEVDALEAALRKAARPVTFHRYPGTGHWFFEPDRTEAFNRAAAKLAWERTLAFLKA
jgi:carboxymethylenebutenolidase